MFLESSPNAKNNSTTAVNKLGLLDLDLDCCTYRTYAPSVSMKKNALKTSLRSATQATDSARKG